MGVKESIRIVDFHCDTLSELMRSGETLATRSGGHIDAKRLAIAGVDLQVFALFSNPETKVNNLSDALVMSELFWQEVNAERIEPVLWRDDLSTSSRVPKGLLSLEGAEPLGTDIRLLHLFFRLGVRAVGLTWNGRNALADGVGEPAGGGLTTVGKTMLREMHRLGIIVDVSHLSEAGFWDVAQANVTFIASHSNCRALCDHPRNLTDDQLKAVAANGGVVGLNLLPRFLRNTGVASSADIVRHAEHMLSVMGRGHVGLGCDFDGIATTPHDLPDVTALPRLFDVLADEFGETVAREIMGESFYQFLARTLPERPQTNS